MQISNITQNNNKAPSFQKFLKTNGTAHKLEQVKETLSQTLPDSVTFIKKKKDKHKGILYILTDDHADKFLDLMKNNLFKELRRKPEKYMQENAKEVSYADIFKELLIG